MVPDMVPDMLPDMLPELDNQAVKVVLGHYFHNRRSIGPTAAKSVKAKSTTSPIRTSAPLPLLPQRRGLTFGFFGRLIRPHASHHVGQVHVVLGKYAANHPRPGVVPQHVFERSDAVL